MPLIQYVVTMYRSQEQKGGKEGSGRKESEGVRERGKEKGRNP